MRRLGWLVGAALYVAIAALFLQTRVLDAGRDAADPSAGDLLTYYYPTLRWGFERIRAGEIPLWDPHQLAGTPFLATPIVSFFYPLYAPFLVLPADVALDLDIVLHLAISGVTLYLLARGLGLGRAASFIAGLVFTYHGAMMIKLFYPSYLASVAWVPLIMLLALRALAAPGGRAAAWLALVFGLSLLGGHGLQFAYLTGWALLPLLAVGAWQQGRRGGSRRAALGIACVVVGLGLGGLLAAARLLPAAELARESWRPPGSLPIETSAIMAADPKVFLSNLFSARGVAHPLLGKHYVGPMREGYVGIVPLALAIAGLLSWRRRGFALAFATGGVAAALYAFGTNSFVFPILYHLPAGGWFRGPDRALVFFGLAVAVLAGAAIDAIMRRGRAWIAALAALGAVVALSLGIAGTADAGLLALYGGTAALLVVVLGWAGAQPRLGAAAVLGLAVLVLADLWIGYPLDAMVPSRLGEYFARHEPFFRAIRERQGLARTYVWSSFKRGDPLYYFSDVAKAGELHGVWQPTDYAGLSGARIERYLRFREPGAAISFGPLDPFGYHSLQLTPANLQMARLLGIRFYLLQDDAAAKQIDPALAIDQQWQLLRHEGGVRLYEDSQALPRAFVVPRTVLEPDAARVLDALNGADLRAVAFVEDAAASVDVGSAPGDARIIAYESNRVVIDVDSPTGGLLVLTDQYFPGWRAEVDAAPAPIYRADYLFRGVPVPAGSHRVEMVYRPRSLFMGLAVSALALVAIAVLKRFRSDSSPVSSSANGGG